MSADFLPTSAIDLASAPDFALGPLRVRPSLREVQAGTTTERLEPRVMQALVALAERPGEVLSRDALLERCWDGRIVGDDAINRCIAKLRKVGIDHAAFTVEAIPRVGYRLVPIEQPTAAPLLASAVALKPSINRWRLPALAAAIAVASGITALLVWHLPPEPLSVRTPFVVTDFNTAQLDASLNALASTTTSEIRTAIERQRLPAASAATRIEIRGDATRDAGRDRVVVKLVAVPSDTLLWSYPFEAPAEKQASLRAQIAYRVTAVAEMANEFLEYPSPDFDAVTLSLMLKSMDGVLNNSWDTVNGAEAAVRRSPLYASAHNAFAVNLLAASVFGSPDQAEAYRLRSIDEVKIALKLEPHVRDPAALIWSMDATDWAGRMKILSGPPVVGTLGERLGRGSLLTLAGRPAEASIDLDAAMARYGGRPAMPHALVDMLRAAGKTEDAMSAARKYLDLRPNNQGMRTDVLDLATLWGEPDEAIDILDDPDRRPNAPSAWLDAWRSVAIWRKTKSATDRRAAKAAIVAAANARIYSGSAVPLMARLGDTDAAFALSDAWAGNPGTKYAAMLFDPAFLYFPETAPMRSDPRFIALADKLGLLKFWRETGVWPDFCRTEPDSVCDRMKAGR